MKILFTAVLVLFFTANASAQTSLTVSSDYALYQNYPNPFNPTTVISFYLPHQDMVTLKVFNLVGGEVGTLVQEIKNSGRHSVEFNGSQLHSGVYVYTLKAGKFSSTRKMFLIK